ncbi:ABC transporter substrate-binding protein [Cryomorpha ignava]|uniref:ABC transporter substrate-binding protein n=1 Tax=Cryomorpha ignava TaxID=101383 RepID=A0A7K3WK82_9FLAO|nr:ABC transporter substrate-binding protein [Cryomorpha ignava]NEN22046.1 ABC transporter substrate-binding protein [Cryomorpha ignava]
MKHNLTLKHIRLFSIFIVVSYFGTIITGCTGTSRPEKTVRTSSADMEIGGLFRMNITNNMRSIFPHNIVDASATNLMNQVYEGLLCLDPETKKIEPALAESYTVSPDGLIYTFKLRKGIYFHDDEVFKGGKGREVLAADVIYCFTKLCEPSPRNQLYAFVVDLIKGARSHYDSGQPGSVEGLRVIDDYTLQIELEYPAPIFSSILTHPCGWIFPKEFYEYKDDIDMWCIGTGPFKARSIKINEVVILERNKKYWRKDESGNTLPYLDAIRCNFIENEIKQLNLLLEGNLDLILEVPFRSIAGLKNRMEESNKDVNYHIITIPGLRVEYYGFQHRSDIFEDVKVRKAINYAIDREFLVDSILHGYGEPATHGFIPVAMPAYPSDSVVGFSYNPDLARSLFAEAGYEGGKDFPVLTLQINDGSSTVIEVADAVQRMLTRVLNITVEIAVLPRSLHYEQIESGQVGFWRDGWIGDYADPENFLRLFHGKLVPEDSVKASFLNTVRFKDPEFDKYFEASLRERDEKVRYSDYWHADQELMNQAVVAPLYYEKWVWLVNNRVRNLDYSGIGVLDLSKVYFAKNITSGLAQ